MSPETTELEPPFDPNRLAAAVDGPPRHGGVSLFLDCVVEELERRRLDVRGAPLDWLLLVRRRDLDEPLYGLGTFTTVDYKTNVELPERLRERDGDWNYGDVVVPERSRVDDYPWDKLAEIATEIAAEFSWADGDYVIKSMNEFAALDDSVPLEPVHGHPLVDLLGREWEESSFKFGDIRPEAGLFALEAIGRVRALEGRSLEADDLERFLGSDNSEIRKRALREIGRADS